MNKRVSITLAICIIAAGGAILGLFRPAYESPAAAPPAAVSTPDTSAAVSGAAPTQAVATQIVSIENFAFGGATTARSGEQVTVTNNDGAAHTLTANDGAFDTSIVDGGTSVTLTMPNNPGTYQFFCSLHPSMTSTITVQS